jgi:hypothetical protein
MRPQAAVYHTVPRTANSTLNQSEAQVNNTQFSLVSLCKNVAAPSPSELYDIPLLTDPNVTSLIFLNAAVLQVGLLESL